MTCFPVSQGWKKTWTLYSWVHDAIQTESIIYGSEISVALVRQFYIQQRQVKIKPTRTVIVIR